MSVSIGIFDLYSFMIPGLLYLFVLNETARVMKLGYFDFSQLKDNLWLGVGILAIAYIFGHTLSSLTFRIWFRLFYRHERSQRAYEKFKESNPDVNYRHESWGILMAVIRRDNPDIAQRIEKNIVDAIMFRNVSFGFMLFAVVQLITGFSTVFSVTIIAAIILASLMSGLAIRQSNKYDSWFFNSIFEHAITFGRTTEEVTSALKPDKLEKKPAQRKSK